MPSIVLRVHADKPNIMDMRMKAGVLFAVLFMIITLGALAEESWLADAKRADGYYRIRDYNAAWLFYERALARGCDDGSHLFQAAESFRFQELVEDPEFSSALYAVAHHFLTVQYPESHSLQVSREFFSPDQVVNRRFIRQTFGRFGGEVPTLSRPLADGFGTITDFLALRLLTLRNFFTLATTEGPRSALAWARLRAWNLLFSWLLFSTLTGILLPVVMAFAVSREGRKSYVTAYAFLFHWGFLGIHRFYLGRWASGVIWLLTGGLLGLGVFFDLFLTGAYVRFWNEDHRGERSHFPGRPRGRAPRKRSTRNPKLKIRPTRKPKPPKPPKQPKPEPIKDDFSFATDTFDAAPSATPVVAETLSAESLEEPEAANDDNFDDLADLEFGDLSEDNQVGFDDEAETTLDGSGELSDDDFNIEALE